MKYYAQTIVVTAVTADDYSYHPAEVKVTVHRKDVKNHPLHDVDEYDSLIKDLESKLGLTLDTSGEGEDTHNIDCVDGDWSTELEALNVINQITSIVVTWIRGE